MYEKYNIMNRFFFLSSLDKNKTEKWDNIFALFGRFLILVTDCYMYLENIL
jgi:hypothetical protein